ncbi:MAG TPA: DUF2723 domain-containing protein [Luteibaculaceae bacterium]|nr:DUF2723 domain-containing protein [Luteibaculaceae bacterium]
MSYKGINNTVGWLSFAIATAVYLLTIEPTASFWDCGEFIASAYKLEVGHPPGAPLFMLLGRLFAAFVPVQHAAVAVNVLSALCSSFTILFLFWTITAFGRKLAGGGEVKGAALFAVMGSGFIGAMAYTFSDSFWFSAVEGEVYAMSSLFTAIVFWAILKWDAVADEPHSTRWLVFIAYMMGLSIGVHLLNLLCIPAIAFVYYFRKFETTRKGVVLTFLISVFILGFIQSGIIPGTVWLASRFELLFVNSFGLPFHTGVLIYLLIITGGLIYGLRWSRSNQSPLWNTALLSVTTILIGYSTFAVITIRSNANTVMNENDPRNVFTLLSYLNREQYGDRPLLYGQYWMAPQDAETPRKDGNPVYTQAYVVMQGNLEVQSFISRFDAQKYIDQQKLTDAMVQTKYIVSDEKKGSEVVYDSKFCTVFPRMYSSQESHISQYKEWSGFKGKPVTTNVRGQSQSILKPTFVENLKFFFNYQVNWMYWRYFMWNFSGRQSDVQGHGNIIDGNYITGIDAIDAERLGNQTLLPDSIKNNRAHNKFYLLPLIVGMVGLIYQFFKDVRQWSVVMLLFFLTGMAIVIYLNQYPYQPRERDYAYAGSFYAFAIWIGLGVYALFDLGRSLDFKGLRQIALPAVATSVVLFLIETLVKNDHSLSFTVGYMAAVGLAMIAIAMFVHKASPTSALGAIVAMLICLPAPALMAKEGWNDHNREKRRTSVDFAKNYLDTCAPNAILFTNGDNDTFPLWYAQEVEGYRTDVRVVNLSLLNTDWYISQMKRKAYDSDPVPFSLEEYQYRQGTRDIVLLDDSRNQAGIPIDVDRLMDFVKDESKKVPVGDGTLMSYMPTKTFSLAVDKNKVLKTGAVSQRDSAQIVDAITWKLDRPYILKNQLMVMDLLATNNWERPVYFAVTTGQDAYLGLEEYFQLEGLAYRLVPVKSPRNPNPNVLGRIGTDVMMKNIMDKFHWGNMDKEHIYMDENNLRMTTNLRLQFANLAEALINEGRNADAKKVLDHTLKVMPRHNVPYDRLLVPIIESYYQLGEVKTAQKLSDEVFDIYEKEMRFYLSLESKYMEKQQNDIRMALAIMGRLEQVARFRNLTAMADGYVKRMQVIQKKLETMTANGSSPLLF